MTRHINNLLPALVLVRIGQELGTDSRLARAIHDVIEIVEAKPIPSGLWE